MILIQTTKDSFLFMKNSIKYVFLYIFIGVAYQSIDIFNLSIFQKEPVFIISLIKPVTFIIIIFIHSGIFSILYKKLSNIKYKGFYYEAKKTFPSLFITGIFLSLFLFVFLVPFRIYFNILGRSGGSALDVYVMYNYIDTIINALFSMVTVYVIPLIYVRKLQGTRAIKEGVKYFFKNLKESKGLIYIIVIKYFVILLIYVFLQKFPHNIVYWTLLYTKFILLEFVNLLIFIVSTKLLIKNTVEEN